jgi:methylenetetrahydrofolate reductase (NADPH)
MTQAHLSFEFFPPQTDVGVEKLVSVRDQLTRFSPEFYSVTYGAGGSTQNKTLRIVEEMKAARFPVAPHVSGIGATKAEMDALLEKYTGWQIDRFVVLRGDLPSGMAQSGEFKYASELVGHMRKRLGDEVEIYVAAYPEYHPQSKSPDADISNFKHKVDEGATAAITQYFFNTDAYDHFIDQCTSRGVTIPIIPGVMPIEKFFQLARFSDACGAEIPRWIRKKLEHFADDIKSIQLFGLEVVQKMCERLLSSGAPGLHFYTMNQSDKVSAICDSLKLGSMPH